MFKAILLLKGGIYPGVLADYFNHRTGEATAGGSLWGRGQPDLPRPTGDAQYLKTCKQIKNQMTLTTPTPPKKNNALQNQETPTKQPNNHTTNQNAQTKPKIKPPNKQIHKKKKKRRRGITR